MADTPSKSPDNIPEPADSNQDHTLDDDLSIALTSIGPIGADDTTTDTTAIKRLPQVTVISTDTINQANENPGEVEEENVPFLGEAAPAHRRRARRRVLSLTMLVVLLISLIAPLLLTVAYSISALMAYQSIHTHATNGLGHLITIRKSFGAVKKNPANVLDISKLELAKKELAAAHADFVQLRATLTNAGVIDTITIFPHYRAQIESARRASQIGIDAIGIGQILTDTALKLAPRLRGSVFSETQQPLLTANDISLLRSTLHAIMPHFASIEKQAQGFNLGVLPLDDKYRGQLDDFLEYLPEVKEMLSFGDDFLGSANWLLGLDEPRTFLVQTMDHSELRPTGGFTGQFGELTINGGRIAPFTLRDISAVEYSSDTPTSGELAPESYRSWWPFANWGLRDSNLSADFPTSAKLAIQLYKKELKRDVDGVILFTPFFIKDILRSIGSLEIPRYKEIITADNLEQRLHYYQLDNEGIRKAEIIEKVEDPAQARKLFTAEVARNLMKRLRQSSPAELMQMGMRWFQELKTRDLQIYFTDPLAQSMLERHNYAGQIHRSNTHDGLYIVQANVSASKASQYVRTVIKDTVTLDAKGGATHVMQLRLVYNQIGPVYGLDTYRDYIRVYVPASARFLWGNGFDTGEPLCGGPLPACAPDGIYANEELVCPTGQYFAGASAPMLGDPYTRQWHPLNKIGAPNNFKSDEPGRAMFGGYLVVPKNCSITATLSWYVPPLSSNPYNLLIQRQAGTYPELDLTVIPTPSSCAVLKIEGMHFNDTLTRDKHFTDVTRQNTDDDEDDEQDQKPGGTSFDQKECYPKAHV